MQLVPSVSVAGLKQLSLSFTLPGDIRGARIARTATAAALDAHGLAAMWLLAAVVDGWGGERGGCDAAARSMAPGPGPLSRGEVGPGGHGALPLVFPTGPFLPHRRASALVTRAVRRRPGIWVT